MGFKITRNAGKGWVDAPYDARQGLTLAFDRRTNQVDFQDLSSTPLHLDGDNKHMLFPMGGVLALTAEAQTTVYTRVAVLLANIFDLTPRIVRNDADILAFALHPKK